MAVMVVGLILSFSWLRGDVIECDNGDCYNGKVLSLDEKKVSLQNEIAGTLTIPRSRIVSISFRDKPVAQKPAILGSATNRAAPRPGAMQIDPGAVQKVQNELLSTANPEANQMFNEMVQGLMSGQMNMADIRKKAQTTLQELRVLQKELGDDETADLLNTYGAILEGFVNQAPGRTNVIVPNAPR